jgi:hypothetical protein
MDEMKPRKHEWADKRNLRDEQVHIKVIDEQLDYGIPYPEEQDPVLFERTKKWVPMCGVPNDKALFFLSALGAMSRTDHPHLCEDCAAHPDFALYVLGETA